MEGVNLNIGNIANKTGASAVTDKQRIQIRKAAEDFEAVFITEMMRPMFEAQAVDPYTGGGQEEAYYKSMMVDEYGKSMSHRGGIGIADHIEKELLKLQEAQNGK
jgi:Rod binding domain-containing protein